MESGSRSLRGIVLTFLFMIVGLALTPSVQELVIRTTGSTNLSLGYANLSGAARALCLLVPLFWVIFIIAIGVASIIVWLKSG